MRKAGKAIQSLLAPGGAQVLAAFTCNTHNLSLPSASKMVFSKVRDVRAHEEQEPFTLTQLYTSSENSIAGQTHVTTPQACLLTDSADGFLRIIRVCSI